MNQLKNKYKLLLFTQSYKTGRGGVASYAHDLVNAFQQEYDITVITGDDYQANDYDSIPIIHINTSDFSSSNAKTILKFIEKEKPSIIINSSFSILSLITPYLSNEIKIYNISHFINGKLAWNAGMNGNYADGIITLSSFGKSYIEKKFNIKDKNKIHIVFNFMPPIPPTYKTKQNRSILKIVYPGGCSYAKSAEIVCKALNKLLKTELNFEFYWLGNTKIAGGNSGIFKTNYIEDCLPNDSRIKHIGPVSRENSKQILSDTNIFLLPSRGEGFPITLIEAMRSGCIPIISNAKHGSLDAITNGKNGLIVRQGSSNDIVNALIDIIRNHEKYKFIYEQSYSYYIDNLTEDIFKKKMHQILNSTSSRKRRIKTFNEFKFIKDKIYFTYLLKIYWVKDRIKQLYHFVFFRYIRYFIKSHI